MFCGACGASLSDAAPGSPQPGPILGAPLPETVMHAERTRPSPPELADAQPPPPVAQGWPHGRSAFSTEQSSRPPGPARFFSHDAPVPPDAGRMSNATRYLCAAAYLSPQFANTVIDHLVASHRAVAPSRGIDIEPVIRHCLKARRLQLTRDILLSILLVLGLFLATLPLILILVAALFLGFIPNADWGRRSVGKRALTGAIVIIAIIVFSVIVFGVIAIVALHAMSSSISTSSPTPSSPLPSFFGPALLLVIGIVYLGAVAGTLIRYTYLRNRTLVEWLSLGVTAPRLAPESGQVERRIAEVSQAQYGNMTLYDLEDPFIGAGITPFNVIRHDERVWSIAIELNRKGARRRLLDAQPRDAVRIDAVDLHDVLHRRLLQLSDPELPDNEQVASVTVDDHVVGEGRLQWESPLIDPAKLIPYCHASREAIEALIRSPQGRLRYYQRVSVSDQGREVLAGTRPVISSIDREVIISAFVYVAVEGHMFYLQFVPASLAPVADEYHVIDRMPKPTSGKFMVKVLLDTASAALRDILGAPRGVWQTWRLARRERKQFSEEVTHLRDYVFADVGARISVRELGSMVRPRTYIQRLDAAKYTQIVERLVIETVLDYLDSHDVDTAAYRARAEAIYNSGIIVGGNLNNNGTIDNNPTGSPG
jgi:hypothetical protein